MGIRTLQVFVPLTRTTRITVQIATHRPATRIISWVELAWLGRQGAKAFCLFFYLKLEAAMFSTIPHNVDRAVFRAAGISFQGAETSSLTAKSRPRIDLTRHLLSHH